MANPAAKPPVSPASVAASPAVAQPSGQKKKFNLAYVFVPLVLLAVGGVVFGLDTLRAKMEAAQQGQGGEERLGITDGPTGIRNERKSRELKPKEPAPAPPPVSEDEELMVGLGKKKKPPPPKVLTPVERAWKSVKADYDKLEARNETTIKKYRIRFLAIEGRKDSAGEAAFIKEAGALEDALKIELAKPENQ